MPRLVRPEAWGVDIKVMQELLRHASCRVTVDTYTQAVTSAKRNAQSSVVGLFAGKLNPQPSVARQSGNLFPF